MNIRKFKTGATRDTSDGKLEYARFLDPRVIRTFAEYMHAHRKQSDGTLREPDNWKKGIERSVYMDSLFRHLMDLWELHQYGKSVRHETGKEITFTETLCAILFNTFGYLYEYLKEYNSK